MRLVSLILVGAMTMTAWAKPGRVVKVERRSTRAAPPRLCEVSPDKLTGRCVGPPREGDRVMLADQDRILGEFRIDKITPTAGIGACALRPMLYEITGTIISGDRVALAELDSVFGLRNLRVDPKVARVVRSVNARHEEIVQHSIDTDGDGTADVQLVHYDCDEHGSPSTTASDLRRCFDTLVERNGKLERVHQDVVEGCY